MKLLLLFISSSVHQEHQEHLLSFWTSNTPKGLCIVSTTPYACYLLVILLRNRPNHDHQGVYGRTHPMWPYTPLFSAIWLQTHDSMLAHDQEHLGDAR